MKNNKDDKLYSLEVENKAIKAGVIGIILLCTIFFAIETIVLHVQNFAWYSILTLYATIVYFYKAIKMPKKYNWFLCFIWLLATIACIFNYVVHRF